MNIHLFGACTATGQAMRNQLLKDPNWSIHAYSRRFDAEIIRPTTTHQADFTKPSEFRPAGGIDCPSIWISFGPIWLFVEFLEELARWHPERLAGLRGLIACSSSSASTKRFAANLFDRKLVEKLSLAEDKLIATCLQLKVPCRILQPTLIYGKVGPYRDRNLSLLLQLMRRLPFLPMPAHSGLRQPIHSSQLAAVAMHLAEQLRGLGWDPHMPERIALGGDITLSYSKMICALQKAQLPGDGARRCRLLPIPNRLFFFLATPLLLSSPKTFEAVLRMGANLSGFIPAHQLLGKQPQSFPLLPLA